MSKKIRSENLLKYIALSLINVSSSIFSFKHICTTTITQKWLQKSLAGEKSE